MTRTVVVTKLEWNGVDGTDVECTYADAPIKFRLDQNVDEVGADALKPHIDFMVCDCILDALKVAE